LLYGFAFLAYELKVSGAIRVVTWHVHKVVFTLHGRRLK